MSSEEAAAAVVPGVHLNGVVVRGEARARALQGRRLGASVLSRWPTKLPEDLAVSAVLMDEEAVLAAREGWLSITGPPVGVSDARQRVFEALWQRGWWLTPALKFAGDFLVYQRHPDQVHSSYIVIVRDRHESIPILDIISICRLGTAVNKAILLASCDGSEVRFSTLRWHPKASNPPRGTDDKDAVGADS
ncbi:tRNA-intron lyase [Plasmodiophora brassicae]